MDDPDPQLRDLFARQRDEDRAVAPRWRSSLLRAGRVPHTTVWAWRWVATAACAVLLGFWVKERPAPPPTPLAALPELLPLANSTARLFSELPAPTLPITAWQSPTDFLLPTHLDIHIL